jgi:hypothetical protein
MHLCLMLAFGITDVQHLGAANQYAPPPEIMSRVVNDRIFNAAMLHEFPTGRKLIVFPILQCLPLSVQPVVVPRPPGQLSSDQSRSFRVNLLRIDGHL